MIIKDEWVNGPDEPEFYDPNYVKEQKQEAEHKYSHLSLTRKGELRHLAKHNLFFLAYSVLGYTRLSTNLHGHAIEWFQWAEQRKQFRMILLPRGHFKSTVFTIADSIRTILPDDSGTAIWPNNLGTDCRLLIAHETREMASRYLLEVQGHILSNHLLMWLFPEIVPNRNIHRINKNELELPRPNRHKEPTIDTMGVGGKSQGNHYNKLKLDDIIGDKARDSQAEMQTARDWVDNIQAFFSTFAKDVWDLSGTRWLKEDVYEHLEDRYGDQLAIYRRPVEEINKKTGLKEPIFPEEFPLEKLNILRKNKKVFSAQYLNDPEADGKGFAHEWIQPFTWINPTIIEVASALNAKVRRRINLRHCFTTILIDPATTGEGGYCVTATDEFNNTYVLVAVEDALRPDQQTEWVFEQVKTWRPDMVCVEKVLFSELYEPWWKAEMKLRRTYFNFKPIETDSKDKEYRVAALVQPMSAGQLFFCEKPEYYSFNRGKDSSDLVYEIKHFPGVKGYHVLDALAQGTKVWRPGRSQTAIEALKQDVSSRSTTTGYSKIVYK